MPDYPPAARVATGWHVFRAIVDVTYKLCVLAGAFVFAAAFGIGQLNGCSEAKAKRCAETEWEGTVEVVMPVHQPHEHPRWCFGFEGGPQYQVRADGNPGEPIPVKGCHGRFCKAGHFHPTKRP